jgi:hypothetical protein
VCRGRRRSPERAVELDAHPGDDGQQTIVDEMPGESARVGPTVCELAGPMPIENGSRTETVIARGLAAN